MMEKEKYKQGDKYIYTGHTGLDHGFKHGEVIEYVRDSKVEYMVLVRRKGVKKLLHLHITSFRIAFVKHSKNNAYVFGYQSSKKAGKRRALFFSVEYQHKKLIVGGKDK